MTATVGSAPSTSTFDGCARSWEPSTIDVDTVRGVGYMAMTPPQPQWIVTDPTQNTVRA